MDIIFVLSCLLLGVGSIYRVQVQCTELQLYFAYYSTDVFKCILLYFIGYVLLKQHVATNACHQLGIDVTMATKIMVGYIINVLLVLCELHLFRPSKRKIVSAFPEFLIYENICAVVNTFCFFIHKTS